MTSPVCVCKPLVLCDAQWHQPMICDPLWLRRALVQLFSLSLFSLPLSLSLSIWLPFMPFPCCPTIFVLGPCSNIKCTNLSLTHTHTRHFTKHFGALQCNWGPIIKSSTRVMYAILRVLYVPAVPPLSAAWRWDSSDQSIPPPWLQHRPLWSNIWQHVK